MLKKILLLTLLFVGSLGTVGCWTSPEPGTVQVQTLYGKIAGIVRSPGIWTVFERGDEYFPVNITSHPTGEVWFTSGTSDRAGFRWAIKGSYHIPDDNGAIYNHVTKWGVQEESRYQKINEKMQTQFQAVIGNIANTFTAYDLVANTEVIRERAMQPMKDFFKNELLLELEDFQLIGKPDFANDDIDMAPSKVVANENLRAAELAGLEADKIKQQRQTIQAQNLANPQLFKVELLKLQIDLEKARAEGIKGHQGNLTLIYGDGTGTPKINLNQ